MYLGSQVQKLKILIWEFLKIVRISLFCYSSYLSYLNQKFKNYTKSRSICTFPPRILHNFQLICTEIEPWSFVHRICPKLVISSSLFDIVQKCIKTDCNTNHFGTTRHFLLNVDIYCKQQAKLQNNLYQRVPFKVKLQMSGQMIASLSSNFSQQATMTEIYRLLRCVQQDYSQTDHFLGRQLQAFPVVHGADREKSNVHIITCQRVTKTY